MRIFTDFFIKSLKPKERKYFVRGGKGFTLCVYPSGNKVWCYIYMLDGEKVMVNIGRYPQMSLVEAQAEYNKLWQTVKFDRKHPKELAAHAANEKKAAERKARMEDKLKPTVAAFVKTYLEKYAQKKKKSWKTDQRVLLKEVVPFWGDRKLESITRRDAVFLCESIIDRGVPAMANETLKILKTMFAFAVERSVLHISLIANIKPLGEKRKRTRWLSAAEIPLFWRNLDRTSMTEPMKQVLKMVLITAQRPGEVAGMHSDEIDGHWWTIPGERTKNGLPHRVYLSPMALQIIAERKGFIFSVADNEAVREGSLSIAINRYCPKNEKEVATIPNLLELEYFVPHDLRRTAASHMSRIRVPREYRERVLNHAMGEVEATYDLYGYDDEKQEALTRWGQELTLLIAGKGTGKVIPFYQVKVAA